MPSDAAIAAFKSSLRGELFSQLTDSTYNEARKVYNAMIDRRPRSSPCADVADVATSSRVNFAREQKLLVAVRGGGHNAGGLGVVRRRPGDRPVADELRPRRSRRRRTVRVGGGCTWGEVDHATHAFGLAVPAGIISTTGVGGLTLGGGIGHLTRRCGLTIDNLLEVDIVLADGRFVTANAKQHAGSLLGGPRRRRQLRRRDVVPVQGAPDPHRLRRADALGARGRRRGDEVVPRVHREGAEQS